MKRRANGEGFVRLRSDGRWECQIVLPSGERKSLYGKTQREVLEKRTELTRAIARGGAPAVANDRQTVGEYLATYLDSKRAKVRPTTLRRYELLVKVHVTPDVARIPITKLTAAHLERLYGQRIAAGAAKRSVRHVHAFISAALGKAQRWGIVPQNVAELADAPKAPRTEMKFLTEAELARLLDAARGDRFEALYVLASTTAMREGELLALKWADVDLDRKTLRVERNVTRSLGAAVFLPPKTERGRRSIDLSDRAVAALRAHRKRQLEDRVAAAAVWEDNGLVFANEIGRVVSATNFLKRDWPRILARAGVGRIRFHDLRHTAITILLMRGIPVEVVSRMAGHATPGFTLDRYGHVIPAAQKAAAAIFDEVVGGRR